MPTVLLVRHGRSTANSSGTLAGWTPGIALDPHGRDQAEALAERLAGLPIRAVVTSPLERCRQTVAPLLAAAATAQGNPLPLHPDERIGECHYGDWTGRDLRDLVKEPAWNTVQQHPSAAVFPGPDGESLRAMQARAVDAVREWNQRIEEEYGPEAVYAMCSHGDVIKAIAADALGLHLDLFQRISVDPASVTAIRYTPLRPFVLRLGDTGTLDGLAPAPAPESDAEAETDADPRIPAQVAAPEDAVVGGSTGEA